MLRIIVVAHVDMLFNVPWQGSAHSLLDISLHYPNIRLLKLTLGCPAVVKKDNNEI